MALLLELLLTDDQSAAAARAQRAGYWIKVSAQRDGKFTVTNSRNGFAKTYGPESRQ